MAAVEIEGLSKKYGNLDALTDCRLEVPEGETFGLLGPNGSGKTTLLRLLMGFLRPSAGRATIFGRDCYQDSLNVHRLVSYLPGDARPPRQYRGRDVIRLLGELRGHVDHRRVDDLTQRLGLDLSRRVWGMSTGMRQQLALVAILSADTPLVILDEPTSNLDPTARAKVLQIVRELAESGKTVILSSHVLPEVEEICQRVGILRSGRLVHLQPMDQVRRQYAIEGKLSRPIQISPDVTREFGLNVRAEGDRFRARGEVALSAILPWLAGLPFEELRIEPLGLRAIYDRFHGISAEEEETPD